MTNVGEASLTWSWETDLDGSITTLWNAEASGESGRVRFRGVVWNATLAPGESADFGFCAQR